MGRPRKRRSGQHHFGEFSSAESSGAFEGSFNSETKNPGGRKHARYAHEKTSHRMESGGRLTRSSRRSVSDARVTAHRISDEIQSGISPFAPDDSVLSQHPVDLDPLDDLKPSSPAQHNEIAESPIGRTMRRRRQTPDRLVHFNDDSNDSMGASRNAFPDTRATTQDRLSLRTQLSDSSASPNSNIIHRLRPRPPEAMLRYSVTRPYRSSHLSPRELKRERHKKRALKERILRRSSSTRHTMTRLRNAGSIADEEAASDEETHQDEDECAEDGERIKTDTRRYPVRNRRHTDVYQVEYAQNNHGPTRNWLAGTGYENGRRRRRHRPSHHQGLQNCGSDTSSSMDSSSDLSTPGSAAYRHRMHASWHREPSAPKDESLGLDEDEVRFARRCTKSILHARSELMPINIKRNDHHVKSALTDRLLSGSSLADIEPMTLDESVGFEHIGGHDDHIVALKESIILPLMYPEIFSSFGIDPPRGVLFTGPPGTGKTLLARALANECTRMINSGSSHNDSISRRPIAFFMRKGADCLSKWVGESERQLRLLFDQAYRMRPSIIFFDEIDGLAPVRSSRQDQVHSSIVSTLLSLMDGLDQRAEVVIIGATNRPDSIDPALRRPGRFDREFTFGLPCELVRQRILEVHTTKWDPKPSAELLQQLAHATSNFSGADLKALATEACLSCLRRQYPQVYKSRVKLALEQKYLVVSREDWIRALQVVRPSSDRSDMDVSALSGLQPSASALAATRRTMLSPQLAPLLSSTVNQIVELFRIAFKPINLESVTRSAVDLVNPESSVCLPSVLLSSPKLLLSGDLPDHLVSAVWHRLELVQVFTLNLANLVAFPSSVGMCPEAALAQILSAVKRSMLCPDQNLRPEATIKATTGVVLFIPQVDTLLRRLPHLTAVYLVDRLQSLMNDLVAETVHCALPLVDSPVGLSDLSQAVSQPARRLLLVATVKRRIPNRPRPLKRNIPTSVASSPAQRITDVRTTPGLNVSVMTATTPIQGTVTARRSNENVSPVRQFNPNSGLASSVPAQQQQQQKVEKLCNGIACTRRTSVGSGRSSLRSPNVTLDTTAVSMRPTAGEQQITSRLGNTVDVDILALNGGSDYPSDADDSLSDGVSSSGTSLDACNPLSSVGRQRSAESTFNSQINQVPATGTRGSASLLASHKISRSARLLNRLFSWGSTVEFHVNAPSKSDREAYFAPVLIQWAQTVGSKNSGTICSSNLRAQDSRPPSPIPVPENPGDSSVDKRPLELSREELLEVERQEAQLFRRLRQVLRRVVAHLARHRRFAVFSRPVQVDEAPDYYEVIKHPMDLGTIRDRIDADRYHDVDDFMNDIELIYYNALEYNPANVPRSRDIRSRASEFWDEACLQLEEELDPRDLNERCKEATEARKLRANTALENRTAHQSHTTNSAEDNNSIRSHSCELNHPKGQGLGAAELRVKLHPMPLGGRYSRRLHGEPPILEKEDVNLLGQMGARRSNSISQSLNTSDSSLRVKLGVDSSPVDIENSIYDAQLSSEPTLDVTIIELSGSSRLETRSPSFTSGVPTVPLLISPSESQSAHASPNLSSASPTIESTLMTQQFTPTGTGPDIKKFAAFHDVVVNGTAGWSVTQLVRLHAEFCAVLSASKIPNHVQLLKELERVFKKYVEQNITDELPA